MNRNFLLQYLHSFSARYLPNTLYLQYRTYIVFYLDAQKITLYLKRGKVVEELVSIDIDQNAEIDSFGSIVLLENVRSIACPVILRLAPHLAYEIVERLPKVAQRDIEKILENRIEVISPFSSDQVLLKILNIKYDYNEFIEVNILIIPNYIIDRARMLVDKIGIKPDIIDIAGEAKFDRPRYNLLRFDKLSLKQRLMDICIISGLISITGLSLVYFLEAMQLRNLSKEAIFQAVERSAAISDWADLKRESNRIRKNHETISARFFDSSSALIILEILSQKIPDNAYLTSLSIDSDEITVSGLSEDPVKLVISLDDLPMFHNVRLINQPERLSKGADNNNSLSLEYFSLTLSFDERAVN